MRIAGGAGVNGEGRGLISKFYLERAFMVVEVFIQFRYAFIMMIIIIYIIFIFIITNFYLYIYNLLCFICERRQAFVKYSRHLLARPS